MSWNVSGIRFIHGRVLYRIVNTKLKIVIAGAVVGFLGAVGIYFDAEEPYKHFVVVAGTLSGVVLALLITTVVDSNTAVLPALGAGAGLGLLLSATVFLAKGGWVSGDAPFVIPTAVVSGVILAPIVRVLRR